MRTLTNINEEQRLYCYALGHREGYSCIGFDYYDKRARAVAEWASTKPPTAEPGTAEHFEQCEHIMETGRRWAELSGERCMAELSPQLDGLEGCRVEVVDSDGERRRFNVGRSTGWLPCHIELHNRRSHGGVPASREYQSVRVIRRMQF